jgi:hypothetical protein
MIVRYHSSNIIFLAYTIVIFPNLSSTRLLSMARAKRIFDVLTFPSWEERKLQGVPVIILGFSCFLIDWDTLCHVGLVCQKRMGLQGIEIGADPGN